MWPFSSKKKPAEKQKDQKAGDSTSMTSEQIRAQALAQFRQTETEMGRETIEEMQRHINFEAAKKSIEDSIDGKGEHSADQILDNLKTIMDDNKR